jgi:hypothetical protein
MKKLLPRSVCSTRPSSTMVKDLMPGNGNRSSRIRVVQISRMIRDLEGLNS